MYSKIPLSFPLKKCSGEICFTKLNMKTLAKQGVCKIYIANFSEMKKSSNLTI